MTEPQFQYWSHTALRNVLYRSINKDNIVHLQKYEMEHPSLSSQQMYQLAHDFELRNQMADQLVANTPHFSMHLKETSPTQNISHLDPNAPATNAEINKLVKDSEKHKSPLLSNSQFYDKTMHALVDEFKNLLCAQDPRFTSITARHVPRFPAETFLPKPLNSVAPK